MKAHFPWFGGTSRVVPQVWQYFLELQQHLRQADDRLKIALCGYQGQYDLPAPWTQVQWIANGGYANRALKRNENKYREVVWFSPSCGMGSTDLFEGMNRSGCQEEVA
jgi:hypothetical protein